MFDDLAMFVVLFGFVALWAVTLIGALIALALSKAEQVKLLEEEASRRSTHIVS